MATGRILLVEDRDSLRRLLARALAKVKEHDLEGVPKYRL